jgi:putative aldouronate transport system permease protein
MRYLGTDMRYVIQRWVGRLLTHLLLMLVSLLCFLPLMMVVSASFTDETALVENGYELLPSKFSTEAYEYVLRDGGQIVRAYGVSFVVTLSGSMGGLIVMALLAYSLSRTGLRMRKVVAFYVLFTLLFNGGLVPTYIVVTRFLQLKNTLWALILPQMVIPMYVLILRTYFISLPDDVLDAARIDGAGEWRTFFQIVMPMSTPAFATIGLFSALLYWNDWLTPLLYIDDSRLYPLQYLMYTIMVNINFLAAGGQTVGMTLPIQPVRMALAVLVIVPLIFFALFTQKYFTRGATLGALRE